MGVASFQWGLRGGQGPWASAFPLHLAAGGLSAAFRDGGGAGRRGGSSGRRESRLGETPPAPARASAGPPRSQGAPRPAPLPAGPPPLGPGPLPPGCREAGTRRRRRRLASVVSLSLTGEPGGGGAFRRRDSPAEPEEGRVGTSGQREQACRRQSPQGPP